eukprot:CAMPEP_0184512110 /NCGR_PEP_ID=MMETSP0198_2-20121128/2705_1 /TAXON_ID=1112570 /ORGANISM="Thraustochytrium sp., Strain LLF1b" /LENGTH=66 /DNA_ID=CAMNT_0026902111 /DNA_START=501 /DNA_END=702 /DNA_ORIENTATION=+
MASVLLNVKEGAAKEIATVAKTLASLSSELEIMKVHECLEAVQARATCRKVVTAGEFLRRGAASQE